MDKSEHKIRANSDYACLLHVQKACKNPPADVVRNWEVVLAFYTIHHLVLSFCLKREFYNIGEYRFLDEFLSQATSGFPANYYGKYKVLRNARRIAQYDTCSEIPEMYYNDAMNTFSLLYVACSSLVGDC